MKLFKKYGSNIGAVTDILRIPEYEKRYLEHVRAGAANFAASSLSIMRNLEGLNYQDDHSSKIFAVRPERDATATRTFYLTIPTPSLRATLGVALSSQATA